MWEQLHQIYHHEIPSFLIPYMHTPEMERLKEVDMNCGMQFTSFPRYRNIHAYSRYDHSVGVACIVYHFTKDRKQTLAGLFHDIATPAFSHVIDFVNYDYLTQESTENETGRIIRASKEIMSLLKRDNISVEEVEDYHIYPIADNDAPKLSADRLEYTCGNILNFAYGTLEDIRRYYENMIIDADQKELCFQDASLAEAFALHALSCGRVYSSDENRYGMEILAEIIRTALRLKIIAMQDLFLPEEKIMHILMESEVKNDLQHFMHLGSVIQKEAYEEGYLRVYAKKRYIDPIIMNKNRVSFCSKTFYNALDAFLKESQDIYLKGLEYGE